MANLFEPREKVSAADTVVNSIKNLILEKKLQAGDKIPTEIEISEGLQVSRSSVREAMKVLSAFGIIDIRVGNGTFVSDGFNEKMMDPFLLSLLLSDSDIKEVIEFRTMTETNIVTLIIEHFDTNEKERVALKENILELEKLLACDCKEDVIYKNDIEFHKLLGKACKNALCNKVYDFVVDIFEPSIKHTHQNQHGKISYKVHKSILDAIEEKDTELAKEAIANSVIVWSDLLGKEI